ncbi:aminotransferase class IV [Hymenobacter elongatus]|uniref:branched-chain-amino-acid transaminase n=1 Tax=Hymenobacter elongatus TaxID=877208 RepID=A0A4Z0PFN6_9BACT|nr:aminotransferase class IV [Hymenobacter elongatus]TGE13937.1 hypothetical protein E5J99_18260 [Hymenobacter elongatus]
MLLLNNHLLPTATLPLPNRGLAFGDGFFETLIYEESRLRYRTHHAARMQQAAAALYLTLPAALATAEALERTLRRLAEANSLPAARLRVQLWRAGGGRYAPVTDATEWLATAEPFQADNTPLQHVDFALQTYSLPSPLSFCKGPQAWLYVRAAHERQQRGLDEIILCDAAGHVAEAGAAAIFWIKEGILCTPALETGCVAGVHRAHLLHLAQQHQIRCAEGRFTTEDILGAEVVFTANVASLRSVERLGKVQFPTQHPLLTQLLAYEPVF